MPKTIISTIKRWPGTVTISEPLTFPQVQAIEDAIGLPEGEINSEKRIWLSVIDVKRLPVIQACVEKWELENFNPDPFPASPRSASHKLVEWLFLEIYKVYIGELEDPNESWPLPIDTPTAASEARR